jgi:hypothetical protein
MPHATNRIVDADIPFVTHGGEEHFITNINDGSTIGYKYFAFDGNYELTINTRGTGSGGFVIDTGSDPSGEIAVGPSSSWKPSSATFSAEGKAPIFLTYQGQGSLELLSISLAGDRGRR